MQSSSPRSFLVALFCCSAIFASLWITVANEIEVDPSLENLFRTRTHDDWRAVWHTERHRRCYHDLLVHMDWVCQKDIYAIRDKREVLNPHSASLQKQWLYDIQAPQEIRDIDADQDEDEDDEETAPFIDLHQARSFLGHGIPLKQRKEKRKHERKKRGIIDECCHASTGCSWEEYAEYCPANSRIRS